MAEFTKAGNFEVSSGEHDEKDYIYCKAKKDGARIVKEDFAKMCRFAAKAGHPYYKFKGFAFEVNENTAGEIDEFFIKLEERIDCGAFSEEGCAGGKRLSSDAIDIDFDYQPEKRIAGKRRSRTDEDGFGERSSASGTQYKNCGIKIKKAVLKPVNLKSTAVIIAEKAEMWTVKFNEQDYGIFSIPVSLQFKRRDNKAINQISHGFADASEGEYGNPVYLSQRNWIFKAESAKEAEEILLAFREYLLRSLYLWEIKGSIVESEKVNDTVEDMDYGQTAKEWPMPFVHNVDEITPETLAAARNSIIN